MLLRLVVGSLLLSSSWVVCAAPAQADPGSAPAVATAAVARALPARDASVTAVVDRLVEPRSTHFVARVPGSERWDASSVAWADEPPPPTGGELPPVTVTAPRVGTPGTVVPASGSLHELVGPNRQPAWTTHRRFTTTRAYVLAPWQLEFESWWEGKFKKDGDERHRFLEELEIGLPGRFQLDFYWRVQTETGEETRWSDFQVEARWALAPWDCLPLNPTIYGEYKLMEGDEPDAWEVKLLLADDIGCRWQWAFNAFYERQTSGDEEIEMGFATGLSYALLDPCLTVGVELKYERTTAIDSRDDPEVEVLLGPSIQWRPTPRVHLDLAPLFGLTDDSPEMQVWFIFGFDILPGSSGYSISAPSSTRGR